VGSNDDLSDVAHSYQDQKRRMLLCGVARLFYLVEGTMCPINDPAQRKSVNSALADTQVSGSIAPRLISSSSPSCHMQGSDGVVVHITKDPNASIMFLASLTRRLCAEYTVADFEKGSYDVCYPFMFRPALAAGFSFDHMGRVPRRFDEACKREAERYFCQTAGNSTRH